MSKPVGFNGVNSKCQRPDADKRWEIGIWSIVCQRCQLGNYQIFILGEILSQSLQKTTVLRGIRGGSGDSRQFCFAPKMAWSTSTAMLLWYMVYQIVGANRQIVLSNLSEAVWAAILNVASLARERKH